MDDVRFARANNSASVAAGVLYGVRRSIQRFIGSLVKKIHTRAGYCKGVGAFVNVWGGLDDFMRYSDPVFRKTFMNFLREECT